MKDQAQRIADGLDRPVVMTGLMGAGKTKIGGLLAKALGFPFIDSDHEIEASAGMTIADIFEQYGEQAFRDLEKKIVLRLLNGDRCVIATGGGAVTNPDIAEAIADNAISVWLDADLDVLVERTGRNEKRPLLNSGNPHEILSALLDKRKTAYARADIHIKTDHAEPDVTLQKMLNALESYMTTQKETS